MIAFIASLFGSMLGLGGFFMGVINNNFLVITINSLTFSINFYLLLRASKDLK